MLGGGERTGTLAVAVDRLRDTIQSGIEEWRARGSPKVSHAQIARIAISLDRFTSELHATGEKLDRLSRTPLIGMLGGGAKTELDKLVSAANGLADDIDAALKEVVK